MVRVLINTPRQVRSGEVFDVRVLISHPMESGQRRDTLGLAIPRDIIRALSCTMAGEAVFEATLFPAIAANPYFAFPVLARRSGDLVLRFTDDHGVEQAETVPITVL